MTKKEITKIINEEKEKWSGINQVVGSTVVLIALKNILKKL